MLNIMISIYSLSARQLIAEENIPMRELCDLQDRARTRKEACDYHVRPMKRRRELYFVDSNIIRNRYTKCNPPTGRERAAHLSGSLVLVTRFLQVQVADWRCILIGALHIGLGDRQVSLDHI